MTTATASIDSDTLREFQPGVFIEINDVITGHRKLARVTPLGTSYDDLDDQDSTPFPIYNALEPAEVGNILGWGLYLVDHYPNEHSAFHELVNRLIDSGEDVLTYNRAAHWAFSQRNYSFEQALAAGKAATAAVRVGRAKMDGILRSAGEIQS